MEWLEPAGGEPPELIELIAPEPAVDPRTMQPARGRGRGAAEGVRVEVFRGSLEEAVDTEPSSDEAEGNLAESNPAESVAAEPRPKWGAPRPSQRDPRVAHRPAPATPPVPPRRRPEAAAAAVHVPPPPPAVHVPPAAAAVHVPPPPPPPPARAAMEGTGKGKDKGLQSKGKGKGKGPGVLGGWQGPHPSGGVHREYYKMYYKAKGKGKLAAFIESWGPPPGSGGQAFHSGSSGSEPY